MNNYPIGCSDEEMDALTRNQHISNSLIEDILNEWANEYPEPKTRQPDFPLAAAV